ncbi:F-box/kelch-repeat protein At3g23880-like [Beta vulgaris subsp. vulgaris]|uniref:F-box/kelch-repeat protein At3g23880-like n=1 Tax=Beta vulgaris subsp. vulgaris TaxID=3555 RepID=UPI0020370146|nr:F-box/kelch-repeat protein At3g23880-like [Beta vulgaris subsp. vulgaris]
MGTESIKIDSNFLDRLPGDLVQYVLLQLPLDSISRFKAVCKKWKHIIESPSFINSYHNETSSNNQLIFVLSDTQLYRISPTNLTDGSSLNIKDYRASQNMCSGLKTIGLIGSCNGLLCFISRGVGDYLYWKKIFLYSPLQNRHRTIPSMPREEYKHTADQDDSIRFIRYGFGYDCSTYDYKLLCVIWFIRSPTCHAYLYSLKRKSWKTLECFPKDHLMTNVRICSFKSVFVNKALHWVVTGPFKGGETYIDTILRFDLVSEEFSLLPRHSKMQRYPLKLNVLEGWLSAWFRPPDLGGDKIEIWVMKEYGVKESCWTKLLSVKTDAETVKPISLSKNENILLLSESMVEEGQDTRFRWYDINTSKRIKEVKLQNLSTRRIYEVETATQSRLTLTLHELDKKRGNRKSKKKKKAKSVIRL